MLRLHSEITIGNLRFNYVTSVNINTSWETLTDTATIVLPSKLTNKDNESIKGKINTGDAVTIKLGYYPNLTTRFTGYVSKIVPNNPMKIHCEDESFLLKQSTIKNYSKKDVTLQQLISDNYSGEAVVEDATLGNFKIDRVSMVKVFQELKNKYKLQSWFRDGVLYSGLAYIPGEGTTQDFHFQRTIISGSNLIKIQDDELNTIAHGVSVQPDGSKIELYTYYELGKIVTKEGDPGGDLNTMTIPGRTKAQMTEFLERWLPNLYYSGFKGSFTTFGEPIVQHGDICNITDLKITERTGKYIVKAVNITFGMNGYRQQIELDIQQTTDE